MKIILFILVPVLLFAGCLPRPPQQESFSEQMDRRRQESEARDKAWEGTVAQERINYVATHGDLKPDVRDAILNGRVVIGMTEEQAWKSLGAVGHDYHSAETASGRAEQWTFRDLHLVFANGILMEIVR